MKLLHRRLKWVSQSCLPVLLACATLWGCASSTPSPDEPVAETPAGSELFQRGHAALLKGDHTRAEQYLKLALDQDYKPSETVLLLVHACLSSSRFRAALNYAEPYLQVHPDEKALRYLVATVHLSLGHQEEAFRALNLLAERSPEYPDTYYLRGVARWEAGDSSAHNDFDSYLALAPTGRHAPEVQSLLSDMRMSARAREQRWTQVSPNEQSPPSTPREEPEPIDGAVQ